MDKYLNKIIHGDCLKVDIPEGLMISDPPYNQNYHYENGGDNLPEKDYLNLLSVLRRPCVVIHYPEETINLLPKVLGKCDEVVSWVYPSNTGKQHRLVSFWGVKPDFSRVKQPYKNLKDKRIQGMIVKGSEGADSYDWVEINQVKNVSDEKTDHPCQIPLELVKRIVLMTTNEGDVVIDPFGGSCTTAVACKMLNRNYICIEKEEKYVGICNERLQATTSPMF